MYTFSTTLTPDSSKLDANFAEIYTLYNLFAIASGFLGVGGVAPDVKFHVGGTTPVMSICGTSGISYLLLGNKDSAGAAGPNVIRSFNGAIDFGRGDSFTGIGGTMTVRFSVDSSGNLLVGQSSVGPQNSNSFSVGPTNAAGVFSHASGSASGTQYAGFAYNGGYIGSISQSGTTAVLYNTTSDERLKTNIEDAPDAGAILDSIQVRSFDWKTADNEHVTHGFIAQELVHVAPQAVKVGDPGDDIEDHWGVDPSKLVPLLVRGWQEQQREIMGLRARIMALESST